MNKYNAEHYVDETARRAIENVDRDSKKKRKKKRGGSKVRIWQSGR